MAAMTRQTRRSRALRTLLDDEGSARRVVEAALTAGAATRLPVIAVVPSPGRWAELANEVAGARHERVDSDTGDAAAMYVAGALGRLADVPIAAVLIDEGDCTSVALPSADVYAPIANSARHLNRQVYVRTNRTAAWPHGPSEAVTVWIGDSPPVGTDTPPWGLVAGLGAIPDGTAGAPRIVTVPHDADPDEVAAAVRSWQ